MRLLSQKVYNFTKTQNRIIYSVISLRKIYDVRFLRAKKGIVTAAQFR